MSHPSWLPPKSTGEPLGHVPARMETTHSFGTPSISVSTQQPPKKFAPVVAPKPKYNPYKHPGGEGKWGASESGAQSVGEFSVRKVIYLYYVVSEKVAQEFSVLIIVNRLSKFENYLEAIKANLSFRDKESETS